MKLAVAALAAVAAAVLAAACAPDDDQTRSGSLVTEADSLRCGRTAVLYSNHSVNAKDLHVRASSDCISDDSLNVRPARLVVLDGQNRVVQNQDVTIPQGTTHRGTFTVPGGARLQLECPGFSVGIGCRWSYSYSP